MSYEWMVGLRYLRSNRNNRFPSIITVISVLAIGLGVTALIVVMSIMGGFEGDLRDKILGAKAHVLVTGVNYANLENPESMLASIEDVDGVEAGSAFIESELMVASPTNYTGVILRGVDMSRIDGTSALREDIVEGELEWLLDPETALRESAASLSDSEVADFRASAAELQREIAELEAAILEAEAQSRWAEGSEDASSSGLSPTARPDSAAGSPSRGGRTMPGIPAVGTSAESHFGEARGEVRNGSEPVVNRGGRTMPPIPGVGTTSDEHFGRETSGERPTRRVIPGVIIGTELQESLNVLVGDTIDIINPDGPLGPTGPIPEVRKFRVVGVFYSGLYEFDHRLVYITIDEARDLLTMEDDEVTGIEVRVTHMDYAGSVGRNIASELQCASGGCEVKDWMELNSNLFAALQLEKVVMGLLLMCIVLIASFAIVCVLTMIVIQKGGEIAILRSMGTPARGILRIFLVQGATMGGVGTLLGALLGIGITTYLQVEGFPLDPEVYYIDQVPVEVDLWEIVTVIIGAVSISLLATLYPSMQAARLDPADGLRNE